jgi:hypothetical protein
MSGQSVSGQNMSSQSVSSQSISTQSISGQIVSAQASCSFCNKVYDKYKMILNPFTHHYVCTECRQRSRRQWRRLNSLISIPQQNPGIRISELYTSNTDISADISNTNIVHI